MKQILKRYLPAPYDTLSRWWWQFCSYRMLQAQAKTLRRIDVAVLRETGGKVLAGPFKGMAYVADYPGVACKVLGTYEKELHSLLEELAKRPYEYLVNVGCAEGYYAVGFALVNPSVTVRAYDTNRRLHRQLEKLAAANQVADRVRVQGICDHAELNTLRGKSVLVLCDIEGAEVDLLDPTCSEALKEFDILVEIHDGPGSTRIRDLLLARFAATHAATLIRYTPRSESDCPALSCLADSEQRRLAVDERRYLGQEWAFFAALGRGFAASLREADHGMALP